MTRRRGDAYDWSNISDVDLMLRVRDDDAGAFEVLVQRYQQQLLRLLTRYLQDAAQAEDATQEVFLNVYQARKRYTPKSKFSTWLFRIALNTGASYRRRQNRYRGTVRWADSMDEKFIDEDGNSPSHGLRMDERAQAVLAALDTLTEPQRAAILLSRYEGMRYADVAATMGVTEKAVKSLISRAHVRLDEALRRMLTD